MTFEESEEIVVMEEEPISPNGLVLKELPTHLLYASLGGNSSKPVIILATLNNEMEKELLLVLKRNIGALSWCIDGMKGLALRCG